MIDATEAKRQHALHLLDLCQQPDASPILPDATRPDANYYQQLSPAEWVESMDPLARILFPDRLRPNYPPSFPPHSPLPSIPPKPSSRHSGSPARP